MMIITILYKGNEDEKGYIAGHRVLVTPEMFYQSEGYQSHIVKPMLDGGKVKNEDD